MLRQQNRPAGDFEASTFQRRPCYRYIRQADHLPTPDQLSGVSDPPAVVKLFDPTSAWTWFIAAYDPETRTAYGLTHGFEWEYGSISMAELIAFRGRFGLPIERDLSWRVRPLTECGLP